MQIEIEVMDAGISYQGAPAVFSNVTATFAAGQVTALVGPSGSGKTSLLAAIAGMIPLTRGSVTYVSHMQRQGPQRDKVVWIPQGNNALGPRSALDNVLIGPLSNGASPRDATALSLRALDSVGLLRKANEPANTLSGGELQRVGFARALASQRPVILADEPSSSLDAANTEQLAGLLTQLSTDATIIVATHDPVLMDAADETVRLR